MLALFISVSDNVVMLIGYISDILMLTGHVIVAYAVIAVHDRMREEHAIDDAVYNSMLKERKMIVLGISLIFLGFTLGIIERVIS